MKHASFCTVTYQHDSFSCLSHSYHITLYRTTSHHVTSRYSLSFRFWFLLIALQASSWTIDLVLTCRAVQSA